MPKKENFSKKNFKERFKLLKVIKNEEFKYYYTALDIISKKKYFIKELYYTTTAYNLVKIENKYIKKLRSSKYNLNIVFNKLIENKIVIIYEKGGYSLKYLFNKLEKNFSSNTIVCIGLYLVYL